MLTSGLHSTVLVAIVCHITLLGLPCRGSAIFQSVLLWARYTNGNVYSACACVKYLFCASRSANQYAQLLLNIESDGFRRKKVRSELGVRPDRSFTHGRAQKTSLEYDV